MCEHIRLIYQDGSVYMLYLQCVHVAPTVPTKNNMKCSNKIMFVQTLALRWREHAIIVLI